MNWLQAVSWGTLAVNVGMIALNFRSMLKLRQLNAKTIEKDRAEEPRKALLPSIKRSDSTLGWRYWRWEMMSKRLVSPYQGTVWDGPELRCESWSDEASVRAHAGIHALLIPPNWTKAADGQIPISPYAFMHGHEPCIHITGIVERFGRYVLGEEGWRAEWVVIRKLHAPTQAIGLELERQFPEVEIVYD